MLAQIVSQMLVGIYDCEQLLACFRVGGDDEWLGGEGSQIWQDFGTRRVVSREAFGDDASNISDFRDVFEDIAKLVARPLGADMFLRVESSEQIINVVKVDLDETSVDAVVEHLGNEVHYVETDSSEALHGRVRQLRADLLGAHGRCLGVFQRLVQILDQLAEVFDTVGIYKGLGGDVRRSLGCRTLRPTVLGNRFRAARLHEALGVVVVDKVQSPADGARTV